MKIIIKEREVDYDTDYPNGWKFSAGDPYKINVMINNYNCFIKRFEKKTIENISGWPLLNALKAKYEPNLPRVHDCKEVQENDQAIHYVFYECIDGETLEKAIEDGDRVDLPRLANDIFSAIQSIHKQQFWFADFCEKNIFCEKSGRYLLVDLDSTEPTSELPNNEIYGSKDYWIPVYRYYKNILGKNDLRLDAISGPVLNYFQLIFLILHLKQYYSGKGSPYKADEQYEGLPALLASISPDARQYFEQALQFKNPAEDFIAGIRKIILHDLLGEALETGKPAAGKPIIREFKSSNIKTAPGESFTLSWQTEKADKLELYRNGELAQSLSDGQKQVSRTEFKDGASRDVNYYLVASNAVGQTKSDSIIITKKQPGKKIPGKWIAVAAGAAILITLLVIYLNKNNLDSHSPDIRVANSTLFEDSVITIVGRDYDDPGVISVLVNKIPAQILTHSADVMAVKVPTVDVERIGEPVTLEVMADDKVLYSEAIPYIPSIAIYAMQSDIKITGPSTITLKGKNLNLAQPLNVYIRNTAHSDSILGTIDDVQKNKVTVSFNRTDVYALNDGRHNSSTDNNGFIFAGFHKQPAVRRLNDHVLESLLERYSEPASNVVESNLSVSATMDSKPLYYEEFRYVRIEHVGSDGIRSTQFDTVIFKPRREIEVLEP